MLAPALTQFVTPTEQKRQSIKTNMRNTNRSISAPWPSGALGPNHPDTATSLNNLAELYHSQGKYEQAEPLYQRALAIREQALGPNHPNTNATRANYAGLLESMKRKKK